MGHVYAVRRTHVLNGHTFHQFNLVNSVLHTLSDRYCSIYGNTAAERKEPLSRQMLKTLLATASGLKLGRGRTLNWDSWFGINLAAAMAVSSSGGFRKGEIALEGARHTPTYACPGRPCSGSYKTASSAVPQRKCSQSSRRGTRRVFS